MLALGPRETDGRLAPRLGDSPQETVPRLVRDSPRLNLLEPSAVRILEPATTGEETSLTFRAFLLLAALAPSALTAADLSGRVLDPDGAAVPGASLRLFDRNSGESRRARSDAAGAYAFTKLSDGRYLLEGEAADAALVGAAEIEVSGDASHDLALAVSGSSVEVVVTASSTPLTLQEVAKALDVVDSEEIALRDELAVSEAVRTVPGLRVNQQNGPGGFTTIRARGLRTHDTAVLIDGLRFRDPAGTQGDATAFYQDMTLVDADRIEVLRGSGSSLYGSHAMAGVLNISSSQGGGRPHGEIRAEGGGLGLLRGVARVGGGLDQDRFVYSGGFSHLNVTDGVRGRTPYRNTSGQGFAKYAFTPKISLSGRVWAADGFGMQSESPEFGPAITANFPASGPVRAVALPDDQLARFEQGLPFDAGRATFIPGPSDPDSRRTSGFVSTAVTLEHQLTPDSSYRLAYQLVDTRRSFQDGPGGPGLFDPLVSNDSRFDGRTHLLQARTDHRLGGAQLLTLGYEYEAETYRNLNTEESPSSSPNSLDIEQGGHAIWGQDQIRLLQGRLQVSLSGRAQWFELDGAVFSGAANPYDASAVDSPPSAYTGDVAVAYFARETGTKLRAHAGNSFRAPSLYERFGGSYSSFSGGFDFWGDPRLSPETSVAVDAGLDQWLWDSKVRLSGTFFHTDLDETILFDFTNFPLDDVFGRFGGYRNAGGAVARGVELSGQVTPSQSTSVKASYTYTNADSRTPTIGADFFGMLGVSDHLFTLTATQWIARRFNVTFDLFAASEYPLSPFGANGRRMLFAGPVKADVVVRYDIPVADSKTVELYGKVENVFDDSYYEDGFSTPGVWAIGGMRFRF